MKKLFAITLLSCMGFVVYAGLTQSEIGKIMEDAYSHPLPLGCGWGRRTNTPETPECQEAIKQREALKKQREASKQILG